jgi:AcrR family transcriptional regulator
MGRKSLLQVRQKEMVVAFYKVARQRGLERTSIAHVAEAMGVNPSLIIHYFKTREELLHGLIEYILERYLHIYAPARTEKDPAARLEMIIENLFSRKWNRLFDDGVFYSCFSLVFRDRKIKKHYKQLHDTLRKMLADTLQECHDTGHLRLTDVSQTADLIFVIVEGAYYYLSMVSGRAEYNRKIDQCRKIVAELLSSVGHVNGRKPRLALKEKKVRKKPALQKRRQPV